MTHYDHFEREDELTRMTARQEHIVDEQYRMEQEARPRCECGTLLEGQYNNGEEHDECAECRAGRLCDESYERVKEEAHRDFLHRMQR